MFNRYRKPYTSRSYTKAVYSPSMYKANYPNYFQQKGRVIQQSPINIRNNVDVN